MKTKKIQDPNLILKGFKVKLNPNKEQRILLEKTIGCNRFIYNYFLDLKIEQYKRKKTNLSRYEMSGLLTDLKQEPDYEWLREVDSTSLQQTLKNLDLAYSSFFKRCKTGKTPGYPKFKKKGISGTGFRCVMNNSIHRTKKLLKIGKLGYLRTWNDLRFIPKLHKVKYISVTKDSDGAYYASVLCEVRKPKDLPKTGKTVGIDLGLNTLATFSNGKKIEIQQTYRKAEAKLKKLQRRLSHKEKGSANRNKARIKVAKHHFHIKMIRKDFNHKLSKQLVTDYDKIFVEDLCIKGLAKTKLAKSIHDAGWSQLLTFLTYKCNWYRKELVKVDRYFPSSKTCSKCGKRKKKLPLSIRTFNCKRCGTVLDRDVNAARNIRLYGLQIIKTGELQTKQEYSKMRYTKYLKAA
jgi:putative transposase